MFVTVILLQELTLSERQLEIDFEVDSDLASVDEEDSCCKDGDDTSCKRGPTRDEISQKRLHAYVVQLISSARYEFNLHTNVVLLYFQIKSTSAEISWNKTSKRMIVMQKNFSRR